MCNLQVEEVEQMVGSLPSADRPRGPMDRWSMDDLIMLAKRLGWLPARVHPRGRRRIGDLSLLVKELRNLAHPGKHIREYPNVRLRKAHYEDARAIFATATNWLYHHNARGLVRGDAKETLSRKPKRPTKRMRLTRAHGAPN
jgi:hypothetical protein